MGGGERVVVVVGGGEVEGVDVVVVVVVVVEVVVLVVDVVVLVVAVVVEVVVDVVVVVVVDVVVLVVVEVVVVVVVVDVVVVVVEVVVLVVVVVVVVVGQSQLGITSPLLSTNAKPAGPSAEPFFERSSMMSSFELLPLDPYATTTVWHAQTSGPLGPVKSNVMVQAAPGQLERLPQTVVLPKTELLMMTSTPAGPLEQVSFPVRSVAPMI